MLLRRTHLRDADVRSCAQSHRRGTMQRGLFNFFNFPIRNDCLQNFYTVIESRGEITKLIVNLEVFEVIALKYCNDRNDTALGKIFPCIRMMKGNGDHQKFILRRIIHSSGCSSIVFS